MHFRQFYNQKGITLVELLAALSLLAIVITLVSTVIMQLLSNSGKTDDDIKLAQDTNVFITEFRHQYYTGSRVADLCYESNNTHDVTIKQLEASNGEHSLETEGACIKDINYEKPLSIKATTTNNGSNSFSLTTTWEPKKHYRLAMKTEESDNDDMETAECKYNGSFILDNVIFKREQCANKYNIEGAFVVRDQAVIEKRVKVHIHGSAHFNGDIRMHPESQMTTSGSIQIDGTVFCGKEKVNVHKKSTIHCN
ncbi:prepilin-type N-terminal cleavage/methylation domain-containing protein [Lentibacillus sp. N15]|uniref:prepilin-type N-terminal cleavage/methylation domain-containing protein n=1 Tax=Lentibacillus songyuanensis TaxID=3136161 RepID=UPI0031BA82F3